MIVLMSEQIDSIHADVAVVGAGPAGAAAAIHAARAGHDTVLIDASPFPRDKTCGDGLTPRAMHQLDLLGIEVNASYRNRGLKLHGFGGSVTAPWPATYPSQEGTALPRYEFDALLVTAAQDAGADTVDANSELGLPVDARDYTHAAQVLRDLGATGVIITGPYMQPSLRLRLQEIADGCDDLVVREAGCLPATTSSDGSPPQSCRTSRVASSAPGKQKSGSTPRSKR